MNLVRIWIWLNLPNMMIEVISNQDSFLDFQKCPHILSICCLKYHFWILVYTFIFQNCNVTMSPANQLQCLWSFWQLIGCWLHEMTILENKSVHWNPKVLLCIANTQNMRTFLKIYKAIPIQHHFCHHINSNADQTHHLASPQEILLNNLSLSQK